MKPQKGQIWTLYGDHGGETTILIGEWNGNFYCTVIDCTDMWQVGDMYHLPENKMWSDYRLIGQIEELDIDSYMMEKNANCFGKL
jgi:hypothetical protein